MRVLSLYLNCLNFSLSYLLFFGVLVWLSQDENYF